MSPPPPPLVHLPKSLPSSSSPLIHRHSKPPITTGKPPRHPVSASPLRSSTHCSSSKSPTIGKTNTPTKPTSTHDSPDYHPRSPSVTPSTMDKIRRALLNDRVLNPTNKAISEVTYLPDGVEATIVDASKMELIEEVARLEKRLVTAEQEITSIKSSNPSSNAAHGFEGTIHITCSELIALGDRVNQCHTLNSQASLINCYLALAPVIIIPATPRFFKFQTRARICHIMLRLHVLYLLNLHTYHTCFHCLEHLLSFFQIEKVDVDIW